MVSISTTLLTGTIDRIIDAQKTRLARLGGVGVRKAGAVVSEACRIGARIFIAPEPLFADRLDGHIRLGDGASKYSKRKDGTAITTRMMTGIMVQATSSKVL